MRDIGLARIGKAVAIRRRHLAVAANEWLLRFEPDPAPGEDLHAIDPGARAVQVRIDGVSPKQLRSVSIGQLDGTASLRIDCVPDGRSGHITAGELVLAMASQFGLAGMAIDISTMPLDVTRTSVSVTVAAQSAADAERVAVFVVAEPSP